MGFDKTWNNKYTNLTDKEMKVIEQLCCDKGGNQIYHVRTHQIRSSSYY